MNKTFKKKRNQFGKVAKYYSKYRKGYPRKIYKIIFKEVPDKKSKVLDLACGTGISTQELAEFYADVFGIDKEIKMLGVAMSSFKKMGLKVNFRFGRAEKIPFNDKYFDLVTVAQAFHWFDLQKAMPEIKRVLDNDGKLAVFWKNSKKNRGLMPKFVYKNLSKYSSSTKKDLKRINIKEILKNYSFKKIRYFKIPFKEKYKIKDFLGFIKSHSTFNLVNPKDRKEYISDNSRDLKRLSKNGTYELDLIVELWIASK